MYEQIPSNLLKIIKSGENSVVEFKKATDKLPNTLFETICGMLNRNGGHVFLGVADNGDIIGVYKNAIKEIRKNFANLCNNPEKLFPTAHLDIKEYSIDDKVILYIYVYESSDVHKSSNKIYDRNEDGDFDITGNTSLISNLYIRKSSTYIENTIYPYATINDLREDLIDKARKMAMNRASNHPWSKMNDIELLRSASLYERNIQTGEEGINLAGILLLGKDEVIKSTLSYYKTDAILKVQNLDRYDDRDDIRTNLLESYEKLVNFISKHLDDKFYVERDQRIDVRGKIARELCVNLLIHREFSNPVPARLIITRNSIITENANRPRNIGYIDLNNYSPYPKNPKIANFFKEIGLADELGSGIKNIVKYTKIYSNGVPSFKDAEVFKVVIPLGQSTDSISLKDIILHYIESHNGISRREINEYVSPLLNLDDKKLMDNKIRSCLTYLKDLGYIKNIGSDRASIWIKQNRETAELTAETAELTAETAELTAETIEKSK